MAKQKQGLLLVRALTAFFYQGCQYATNDLVELPEVDAKKLESDGTVDSSDAGVDYCKKQLKKEAITHVPAGDEEGAPEPSGGEGE